jgi:hypothetical protein
MTAGPSQRGRVSLTLLVAVCVALSLVGAGVWWAARSSAPSDTAARAASAPAAARSVTAGSDPTGPAEGAAGPGGGPSAGSTAPSDPSGTSRLLEVPQPGSSDAPVEPTPSNAAASLPGLRPAPHLGRWLVSAPLPGPASARGRLVRGFPRAVLPTPGWAAVRSSSVSSQGTTLQVTLRAVATKRPAAVIEHYRSALVARGFGFAPAAAAPGRQALEFTRRSDSVVLTVGPGRSAYSLFAVLHAAPRR